MEREEHLMFIFKSSKQISLLACEDTHMVIPGVRLVFSYFLQAWLVWKSLTLPQWLQFLL